jgi:regulator of protease activity HflC (stomatin/prohibitin superfamily)
METFAVSFSAIAVILLLSTFRILREYDKGVIFMHGRFYKVKGPGLIWSFHSYSK